MPRKIRQIEPKRGLYQVKHEVNGAWREWEALTLRQLERELELAHAFPDSALGRIKAGEVVAASLGQYRGKIAWRKTPNDFEIQDEERQMAFPNTAAGVQPRRIGR